MPSSYAKKTKVPVSQTQREIRSMINDAGASRFGMMDDEDKGTTIGFTLNKIDYRIDMPLMDLTEQKDRSRWRELGLIIKAKLIACASGITSHEAEFLQSRVMPTGRTFAEDLMPQVEDMTSSGKPRPLMLEGPR